MSAREKRLGRLFAAARQAFDSGRPSEAMDLCARVLRDAPDHVGSLKLGAVAAFQSGDRQRALSLAGLSVERYPDDPEARFNLGVIHQAMGLLEEALGDFRAVATLTPGNAAAHYNLATALHELGRAEDAVSAYRDAIQADPGFAPAHAGLAFVLRSAGRLQEALCAYEAAIERAPQDPQTLAGYGITLQHCGRLSDAAAALQRASTIDPDYPDACTNLADVLVQQGDAIAAVAVCDGYLERNPGDSGALAAKAIALNEAGETAAFAELVDLDRFLAPQSPAPPMGFADIAAFNDALAERMLSHPTLVDAPASHATRNGKHTGELLGDETPEIAAFQAMVDEAVGRYREALGADRQHPFVVNAPRAWRLTAWSIVLQGAGGYQAPHIHPSAWLSGVYYVRVPDAANNPDSRQAGWIEFGLPSEEFHWTRTPPVRALRPEPGLLVLFPSYVFHRTIPYDTKETRISIAFDVLPAR